MISSRISHLKHLEAETPGLVADISSGTVRLEAGSHLNVERSGPTCLYLLVEGWAIKRLRFQDSHRSLPTLVFPGDFVDLSHLSGSEISYDVEALTECRCMLLPYEQIDILTSQDPVISKALFRLLLLDNISLSRQLVALASHSAHERVALLLDRIAEFLLPGITPRSSMPLELAMIMTHAQLGELLGLSAVHVQRIVQRLVNQGIIRRNGKRIEILDRHGLRRSWDHRF